MILKTPHLNQQEYNKVMIWKIDQMSSSLSFQRASLELLLRRTPHTQTNQTLAGGFFPEPMIHYSHLIHVVIGVLCGGDTMTHQETVAPFTQVGRLLLTVLSKRYKDGMGWRGGSLLFCL